MEPKNTAAWITCFAAWLTARDDVISIGASEDCARVAELVEEYRLERDLPEVEWEG